MWFKDKYPIVFSSPYASAVKPKVIKYLVFIKFVIKTKKLLKCTRFVFYEIITGS